MSANPLSEPLQQTQAITSIDAAWGLATGATARLNHVDTGKGEPAIVFIHGFSCSLSDWDVQVRTLSKSVRCIAVDLPGHGKSPRSGEPTIEAMATSVVNTLKAADVHQAVLVGSSMGCRVQSEVYRQAPELVSGQVYVDGSIFLGDSTAIVTQMEERIARFGFDQMLDGLYKDFFVESSSLAVREYVYARRSSVDPAFHSRLFTDILVWDAMHSVEALRSLKVPVLAIQSTTVDANLKRVPIAPGVETPWMKAIRENVPGARIVLIEGVGHFTMLEAPERVNELISGFSNGR
ncbi:alpha/beta fold hydrolase [Paraburkholderia sp.]|uniref:alpha/beta fold hydrolase n=1 Tax=Paraburkholderia sp. TaxID=1926495 RepID=UPI003D6F105F